ncbi:hypothetical protein ACJIZ3_004236 [Penstemon smallii]|uniref:Replication protein A subunit n=1 Tax=Penstemon smallii TaxID=265156 RepID=A0ABD3S1I6_9LAMI
MSETDLTKDAIAILSGGDAAAESDIRPVLQVADIRLVETQNQTTTERYRILLSDGSFTQQGMLATQQNDLVRSEKLQKGSIVKLTQFVCNLIQNRMIVIIVNLDVLVEKCDPIGEPKPYPTKNDWSTSSTARQATPGQPVNQPASGGRIPSSFDDGSAPHVPPSSSHGSSFPSSKNSRSYNTANASPKYPKTEYGSGVLRAHVKNPPKLSYHQPPHQTVANRGPIAPRIIPIAALNPFQGGWTIKARVTSKGDLRRYTNTKGDGKVFSFDLLDFDGGEIKATCFNVAADKFHPQIELGRVYMISNGSVQRAKENFNHLPNEHEIFLNSFSTMQPCFEDDKFIPHQQFHFLPISDVEKLARDSNVDIIGVVSSISPSSSILRKNGTETQKRTLQLKDMSGRSVELTLWSNFCNAEGQTLEKMLDSGLFPVLAVKSGRVNDFNGKSVGTTFNSQFFIEPDFPEAQRLKTWFDGEGKCTPAIPISWGMSKTVSQIKDEKLGTLDKPDWITVSATLTYIKMDNFCYTACPIMIGDHRPCNKKVTDNGNGKWRCEKCDVILDKCDYRYILQMQIQDHTGTTWVTAFQESGEEIMGISAKDLCTLKHDEQDDVKFAERLRSVLFTKFLFKLKVKEEIFNDEACVKSTVVKAEKVNFQTQSRYLLDSMAKFKDEDLGTLPPPKSEILFQHLGRTLGNLQHQIAQAL